MIGRACAALGTTGFVALYCSNENETSRSEEK
jgi:hypothetical protein